MQVTAGAALLLATAMLLAAPAAAADAGSGALWHSKHWGKAGEAWTPAGPIMDFSFAGEGRRLRAAAMSRLGPAASSAAACHACCLAHCLAPRLA